MTDTYRDAFGSPIDIGDTVGTRTTSKRYSSTYAGTITKLGKGQVKIRLTHGDFGFASKQQIGSEVWVQCPNAIKTDPPANTETTK